MRKGLRVFVDSDVIISALISDLGAAAELVKKENTSKYVSNLSKNEIERVAKELGLSLVMTRKLLATGFKTCEIGENLENIVKKYSQFVLDVNDSHVTAGAVTSKSKFLVTYNLKHYRLELIKQTFGIIVLAPGQFLQYLRSLKG